MNYAILAAGGKGVRFGGSKQFHLLMGKPLFLWAVEVFQAEKAIDQILFVYPADEQPGPYGKLASGLKLVQGGATRFESVRNGFDAIVQAKAEDLVLIHDVARPLLSSALLRQVLEAAGRSGAVIPGLPVQDTVKEVVAGRITQTVPRHNLWLAQTPQGFRYKILKQAYDRSEPGMEPFTDEAAMVEAAGFPVTLITGERSNIKITNREDLALAEFFCERGVDS